MPGFGFAQSLSCSRFQCAVDWVFLWLDSAICSKDEIVWLDKEVLSMTKINVHRDPQVESLIDLYGELLTASNYQLPIQHHLEQLSERILDGHGKKHPGIAFVTGSKFPGTHIADVFSAVFTLADAKNCVARNFGYKNWTDVTKLEDLKPDAEFESLVDALLAGDLSMIKDAIAKKPEIVHQCSSYPHKATLLHYTGSNGVEGYRQIVPSNLVDIVETLLSSGADSCLEAQVYGGCTAENLMKTSKHPHDAGMYEALQNVFNRYRTSD